jgi:DNA invertase Pin-like site-specific DNA recombinase
MGLAPKAICYIRVSPNHRGSENVQYQTLTDFCKRKGWDYTVETECFSGKTINEREKLSEVIDRLNRGEATYLLVYKIDRLTRKALHGLELRDMSIKNNWRIIIPGMDIYNPDTFMAFITTLAFAELEASP